MKANQLNNSHSTHLITVRTCWIVRRAAIATDANSSACFTSRPRWWNAVIFRQVVASAISGACCCNRLEESLQEDVGGQGTDAFQRKSHLEPTGRAADDCRFLPGVDLQAGQAESVLTRQLLVHKSRKTKHERAFLYLISWREFTTLLTTWEGTIITMVGRMSCSRQMAQRTKSSNDWLAWRGCGFERSLVGSFSSLRVRERRTNLFKTPPRFLCLAASLSVTTRGILT